MFGLSLLLFASASELEEDQSGDGRSLIRIISCCYLRGRGVCLGRSIDTDLDGSIDQRGPLLIVATGAVSLCRYCRCCCHFAASAGAAVAVSLPLLLMPFRCRCFGVAVAVSLPLFADAVSDCSSIQNFSRRSIVD